LWVYPIRNLHWCVIDAQGKAAFEVLSGEGSESSCTRSVLDQKTQVKSDTNSNANLILLQWDYADTKRYRSVVWVRGGV
jgi:hypothetical protein